MLAPINSSTNSKKRILIVNAYFDDMRLPEKRKNKVPMPMGPAHLAGAFQPDLCEIKLINEMYSGPLLDEKQFAWPDMLVLTGLTVSFDRMRQLTAYAKTKNPNVIVVAGGPAIRALPKLSLKFFDEACLGDVEEMQTVIKKYFGAEYVSKNMIPRFDLTHSMGRLNYVETSRNCNFSCSFCSIAGEGGSYLKYDLEFVRKQIMSLGKNSRVVFIDNNFYGNDRQYFIDRLELFKELRKDGYMGDWAALVTNDFFFRPENLKLAKEAGCIFLFSGVESFNNEWLESINKKQNTKMSQVDMIRLCYENGILFFYGYMFDLTSRPISELREEIEFMLSNPEIPMPSYFSVIVPILGTKFFYESLEKKLILPNTKLRDLDSTTLSLKPQDSTEEALKFIYDIQTLRGYKTKLIIHELKFIKRYWKHLSLLQMFLIISNSINISMQNQPSLKFFIDLFKSRNSKRTHLSCTEPLDELYTPAFPVDSKYQDYFRPIMITDKNGCLSKDIEEDVLGLYGKFKKAS
jgi:hopanoid C-2 methylase